MSKKVELDQEECIGCESCVELCPEVFGFAPEVGKAYVLEGADGDSACVEEAATACPVACISVG
ncbi:ferredoxin [Desulfurivibrio alkaliphilus]|uniref:Ferredoxin n=1 Tax=Desulfurivibrio alkaliphilus (strain DSM 19089 / UNIQEM U267 / AHT2) TaxID=589865 RepID=D6Z0T6_DESAT|nr:ferredoxin [Desulfurivibrio alkaliphilus]ADH87196.1 4Fe-4S ferredoxin iron-sulfur binding domain protein [Desulfurivibrio alkaliphilus AHT 2]